MKTFIALTVAALCAAACAAFASADGDPLVGNWTGDSAITITNAGGVYNVTFTTAQTYGSCKPAAGTLLYTLTPTGNGYYSEQVKYDGYACTANPDLPPSTIKIDVVGQSLFFRCESDPSATCSQYSRVGGKDTTKPWVQALPSSGKASSVKITHLNHYISDDSGKAALILTIYKGSKLVDHGNAPLGTVSQQPDKKLLEYLLYFPKPTMKKGVYRWCLQAKDAAGNLSAKSCASLTLR